MEYDRKVVDDALTMVRESLKEPGAEVDIEKAKELAYLDLAGEEREHFLVIWLDTRRRLIKTERLFSGSVNQSAVHPREVVKAGLACNAAAAIVSHNHPSGDPSPSNNDEDLTSRLAYILNVVDIELVDHIIVGSHALSLRHEWKTQQVGGAALHSLERLLGSI